MKNRIFFLSPDNRHATGGVKQLYRQVDILNQNGFNAFILHKKIGHKSKFFKNNTQIKYNSKIFNDIRFHLKKINASKLKLIKLQFKNFKNNILSLTLKPFEIRFEESDILVFPEIYGTAVTKIEKKLTKVIFNQNCYYSFDHFSVYSKLYNIPYLNNSVKATIVASNDAFNYLNFTFPELKLFRLRLGIDESVFNYSSNKKKQIAFMPRKLEEDVVQVINILKSRNNIKNWEFIPISNKNEIEVAQIMKESAIFLSFNHREGFGLPPAEAMACGCIVIGYTGKGGDEYFKEEFSYRVDDRDVIGFVKKIENVIKQYDLNKNLMLDKSKKASEFILNEYSLINEENDAIQIWKEIV